MQWVEKNWNKAIFVANDSLISVDYWLKNPPLSVFGLTSYFDTVVVSDSISNVQCNILFTFDSARQSRR